MLTLSTLLPVALALLLAPAAAKLTASAIPCDPSHDYFPEKVTFRHAALITDLTYKNTHVDLALTLPDSADAFQYRFVHRGCEGASALDTTGGPAGPADRISITVPAAAAYLSDSISLGMVTGALNLASSVRAVGPLENIYSPLVRGLVEDGSIASLADVQELGKLEDEVDVAVINSFEEPRFRNESGLDVPTLVATEPFERTPLGRAEWVKLFALLLGREVEGDRIFGDVEAAYLAARERAKAATSRPSVLMSLPTVFGWTLSGGDQYTARFVEDAQADYLFAGDGRAVGRTLSVAEVAANFSEAEVWINVARYPYVRKDSVESLIEEGGFGEDAAETLRGFRAVKEGRLWSQSKDVSADGKANNFFEMGAYRPDRVLDDLVSIFHPELGSSGRSLNFYYSLDCRSS